MTGPFGRDVAEQVRDHALREIVCLDPVGNGETLQLRNQPPVPADHAPHQPFMAEMVEPTLLAIALARGIDEREIARLADLSAGLALPFDEMERLQRHRDLLGETDADEAAGRDGIAVAYQADRFFGADDLSAVRRP